MTDPLRLFLIGMVLSDFLSSVLQIVGAVLVGIAEKARYGESSSPISSMGANDILLTGLCVQVSSLCGFKLVSLGPETD